MSRVINPDTGGKLRMSLSRNILHACKEAITGEKSLDELRDILVFVYLSLNAIDESINTTVEAWERRDYWVKADKFRLDWSWVKRSAASLNEVIQSSDWLRGKQYLTKIQMYLAHIQLSPNNRLGHPWQGAWEKYNKTKNSRRG